MDEWMDLLRGIREVIGLASALIMLVVTIRRRRRPPQDPAKGGETE
jgi:hypothetical protein